MNVGDTLYYFRKSRGLKQREILDYNTSSVYSKIESDKQELKFSELMDFIDKVDITSEEFFEYIDNEQMIFRKLFKNASSDLENLALKEELLTHSFEWNDIDKKSLREISNYVAIRVFFSEYWNDIQPLSSKDLDYLFRLLNSKKIFFQYDYILLANIIYLLTEKQIDILITKAFPLKENQLCTYTTQSIITNLINNLISNYLYKENYTEAINYLNLAKKQKPLLENIRYKIVIVYLTNLTQYLMTGEYTAIKKVYDNIEFLLSIGEKDLATNMKVDTKSLTQKNKHLKNQTTTHIFTK